MDQKTEMRWNMSWSDLAESHADGVPGSRDWEQARAVLECRIGSITERAAKANEDAAAASLMLFSESERATAASTATAMATQDLFEQTRRLFYATALMALATVVLAVVTAIRA
jgi:hypothetical protein